MLSAILSFLGGGTLDKIFKSINDAIDNETQREALKAELAKSYLNAQVSLLSGRGWWFPVLFLIPAGAWFASVVFYSILFCKLCIFPQPWTIAALPAPLDDWLTAMIGSLFVGKAGEAIIARIKK